MSDLPGNAATERPRPRCPPVRPLTVVLYIGEKSLPSAERR